MKKVNYILAAGLMQQEDIVTNLAKAIEANSRLGAFLADPEIPNPTFEEVQERVHRNWSTKKELLEFSFRLTDDFIWRCDVKYQYPVFYKTAEDAAAGNCRYSCSADENYTIPSIYKESAYLEW